MLCSRNRTQSYPAVLLPTLQCRFYQPPGMLVLRLLTLLGSLGDCVEPLVDDAGRLAFADELEVVRELPGLGVLLGLLLLLPVAG